MEQLFVHLKINTFFSSTCKTFTKINHKSNFNKFKRIKCVSSSHRIKLKINKRKIIGKSLNS